MSDATRTVLNCLDELPLRTTAEALKTLTLAEGFDPNLPIEGRLVLVAAAGKNNVDFVRILLEAGAYPNLWDTDEGTNALGAACRSGVLATLKLLLDFGANPNLLPIPGTSPPASPTRKAATTIWWAMPTEPRLNRLKIRHIQHCDAIPTEIPPLKKITNPAI